MFKLKKRGKIWHYYFSVGGKVYRGTTKQKDKSLAEKFVIDKHNKIYQKQGNITNNIHVADLTSEYIKSNQYEISAEWLKNKTYLLNKFIEYTKSQNIVNINEITLISLEHYKAWLLEHNKPQNAANNITVIKSLLNFAVKHSYLDSNPANKLSPIRVIKKNRERFFAPEEIQQILHSLEGTYLYNMVYTALYTGMRRRELIYLEYADVDVENMNIHVKNKEGFTTKSRKDRVIPLHTNLINILSAKKTGYCFLRGGQHIHEDTATRNFKTALQKLGINDAGLHTLRHTFISHCLMQGKNIWEVAKWAGHSTVYITEMYGHLCPNRREIDSLVY